MSEAQITAALEAYGEPDDVLELRWADEADREAMSHGCHFDYRSQQWVDGHDHAHIWSDLNFTALGGGPLAFCGADLATCQGEG